MSIARDPVSTLQPKDIPVTTTAPQPQASTPATNAPTDGNATGPMHAAIDHAAEAASSAAQSVQQGVATVREALDHCVEDACRLGADCAEATRDTVRARPLTIVLAALAAGVLIGRLCR